MNDAISADASPLDGRAVAELAEQLSQPEPGEGMAKSSVGQS